MTAAHTVLLLSGIAIIAYPIVMRVLARAVQERRLRLAEVAAILSRREGLSDTLRDTVAWALETAYSPWVMVYFVVTMPLFIVDLIRGRVPPHEVADNEIDRLMDELSGHHIASVAAANPLFALVASLEWAILFFVLFPLGKGAEAAHMQVDALARVEQIRHRLRPA